MTQRKHILFICTGNTCRSPMAEGLFRKLSAHHPEWQGRFRRNSRMARAGSQSGNTPRPPGAWRQSLQP